MKKNYINPRCVPLKLYRRQLFLNAGLLIMNIAIFKRLMTMETKVDLLYHKLDISTAADEKARAAQTKEFFDKLFSDDEK